MMRIIAVVVIVLMAAAVSMTASRIGGSPNNAIAQLASPTPYPGPSGTPPAIETPYRVMQKYPTVNGPTATYQIYAGGTPTRVP